MNKFERPALRRIFAHYVLHVYLSWLRDDFFIPANLTCTICLSFAQTQAYTRPRLHRPVHIRISSMGFLILAQVFIDGRPILAEGFVDSIPVFLCDGCHDVWVTFGRLCIGGGSTYPALITQSGVTGCVSVTPSAFASGLLSELAAWAAPDIDAHLESRLF